MSASLPRPSSDENISTTLSAGITDIATSMSVSDGSKIVAPCYLVVDRVDSAGTSKATSLWEYVKVTNVAGNDLTITRGQGGSTAQAHGSGAVVEAVVTSSMFEDWYAVLNPEHDSAGGHVITGTMTIAGMNLASVATIAVGSFGGVRATSYINASGASLSGFNSAGILITTQYAPQGFLINGKIVPSVATNNLTVAIKGMDGNDPSVLNPVYCRIGDTVRTITAALSVTKDAGTNWFNSGSAELAAREIDYFVYLGYNATDGVVIGFSRIPHATRYDSFSTTTTAETYCGISTITSAAAGDYYELIGRFAATLSAGAGYTWSVPTFTAINLIQRPIYQTRSLVWLPTYAATGSMTFASTSTGNYQVNGNWMAIVLQSDGTTGGTASTGISFTLPFSYNTGLIIGYGIAVTDTAAVSGVAFTNYGGVAKTKLTATKYDGSNWGIGASRTLYTGLNMQV